MKINTNSWHYRLIDSMSDDVSTNLCPYVRQLLKCIFIISFVVVIVGVTCWAMGSIPIAAFTALTGFVGFIASLLTGLVILSIGIAIVAGVVIGTALSVEAIKNKLKQRKIERIQSGIPEKEPTLMVSWIKAKHDKMCPRLEFKGE